METARLKCRAYTLVEWHLQKCHKYKILWSNLLPQVIPNCQHLTSTFQGRAGWHNHFYNLRHSWQLPFFLFAVFCGYGAQKPRVSLAQIHQIHPWAVQIVNASWWHHFLAVGSLPLDRWRWNTATPPCHSRQGGHKHLVQDRTGFFNLPSHSAKPSQSPEWRTWMRVQDIVQHTYAVCSALSFLARCPVAWQRLLESLPCFAFPASLCQGSYQPAVSHFCAAENQRCHWGWCIWVSLAGDRQVHAHHHLLWLSGVLPDQQKPVSSMDWQGKRRNLPFLDSQRWMKRVTEIGAPVGLAPDQGSEPLETWDSW